MSIAVLTQVYDEVRRLAIAGSVVACNDFRLKKLIPPLQQAGQKAPVFAKVAESVDRLVESDEQGSAAALLELSTLVNAVLYTQGETGIAGELEPLAGTGVDLPAQAPARLLKPLLEALSRTGSGRLEIVRDAIDRGLFRDLRLVLPAVVALDDAYPEIADLVAERVLPTYGSAVVPALRERLDVKGHRRGDARRLAILHRLDPQGSRPLVERALEEGSKEMRVAAIGCLGSREEDLSFLLEQSRSRAKDVRAAALSALARCGAPEAVKRLQAAVDGADLGLAVAALRGAAPPDVTRHIVECCAGQWERLGQKEESAEKRQAEIERFVSLLSALQGTRDESATALLLRLFAEPDSNPARKNADIGLVLAQCLAAGTPAAQRALVDGHARLGVQSLIFAVALACRIDAPEQVFERFSPYVESGLLKRPTKDKRQAVVAGLIEADAGGATLDPRWLDLAIRQDSTDLALALARPQHAGTERYLSELWRSRIAKCRGLYEVQAILHTLVRIGHPEAPAALCAAIDKRAKDSYAWDIYLAAILLADLPTEALPAIEAWLPTLPDKVVDKLAHHVDALRERRAAA